MEKIKVKENEYRMTWESDMFFNKPYTAPNADKVFFLDDNEIKDMYGQIIAEINGKNKRKYAFISTGLGAGAVLNGNRIAVLMGDIFAIVDLDSETMIAKKHYNTYNSCFGLYVLKDGYLAVTEAAVIKTDFFGELIWEESGADIFVNPDPEKCKHIITDKYIELYDFNDFLYRFDLKTGENLKNFQKSYGV